MSTPSSSSTGMTKVKPKGGNNVIIHFNVTGPQRKKLATALGAILFWEPVYAGAPTFAYKVGSYTVDKTGAVTCPKSATREIVGNILEKLNAEGFRPESIEHDRLSISLPRCKYSDEDVAKLRQIAANKAPLFQRAF